MMMCADGQPGGSAIKSKESNMQRLFFCLIALMGMSVCAFSQSATPDGQTLKDLLSEVRALRQDLQLSLNRAQTMQILLARFQMQEGVITRTSDRLNDARQKLLEAHASQKELTLEVKRLEDSLNTAENPQQQADLQDRIKHVKSDLEVAADIAQQRQAAEIQAQQQLRDEQDKLNALESQLDDLIRTAGNTNEKSLPNHP
jgi:DNA repair exonuclease SbcCD ATPase subunit